MQSKKKKIDETNKEKKNVYTRITQVEGRFQIVRNFVFKKKIYSA